MKRILPAIAFSVFVPWVLSACATMDEPARAPLTLADIVDMAKKGNDASAIIDNIKASQTTFDVTASQYAKLSKDGVPDAVLDFMQQGQLKMAERQGRRDAYRDLWPHGWGWAGYGPRWHPRTYYVYVRGRAVPMTY
jgi:hypothetical protein